MDRLKKFLAKLDRKRAQRMLRIVEQIERGDLRGLDIKPLTGWPETFRCRVGDIRIIFRRTEHGYVVKDAGFRGGIYR